MPGFLDWISSGISTAVQPFTNWLDDPRSGNLNRPRLSSSDPSSSIDSTKNLNILNFPHDRPKYYITFGFEEYQRPNQFQGLKSNGVTDYICLPIPNNMLDYNNINYAETPGHILGEALSLAHENGSPVDLLKTGGVGQLEKNIGDAVSGLSQGVSGWGVNKIIDGLSSAAKGLGEEGAIGSLEQIAGLADNPFMTVMLKGPKFKHHRFQWRLAPKSQEESTTIKNITDTFKKMAYPELLTLGAGGFFKYPHIVWPKFQPDAVIDKTYKFKPCVLTDVNVNYTPNDRPGFYTSSAPLEILFEIALTEIELWRGGDGDSGSGNSFPTINGDFSNVISPPLNLGNI